MNSSDLDGNQFYSLLKKKFAAQYKAAKKNKHTICIPHSSSLNHAKINRKLIESHILKPLPRFLNEFISIRKDKQLICRIENGSITPVSGFDKNDPVSIIHEELCYNENYEAFHVYLIERIIGTEPLLTESASSPNQGSSASSIMNGGITTPTETYHASLPRIRNGTQTNSNRNSLLLSFVSQDLVQYEEEPYNDSYLHIASDWHNIFLTQEPSYRKYLDYLNEEIELFNKGFVYFGKNPLPNTAEHIRTFHERVFQEMRSLKTLDSYSDLSIAVESYIIEGIAKQLYRSIQDQNKDIIYTFSQICPLFAKLDYQTLKIDQIYDSPLTYSIESLERLHSVVTPFEISCILCSTVKNISIDVKNYARVVDPFKKRTPDVSADELVPLISRVIARSNLLDLEKYLQVVKYFRVSFSSIDGELDYAYTTFVAANQLIFDTFPNYQFISSDSNVTASTGVSQSSETKGAREYIPRTFDVPAQLSKNHQQDNGDLKNNSEINAFSSTMVQQKYRKASVQSYLMPSVIDVKVPPRLKKHDSHLGISSYSSLNPGSSSEYYHLRSTYGANNVTNDDAALAKTSNGIFEELSSNPLCQSSKFNPAK